MFRFIFKLGTEIANGVITIHYYSSQYYKVFFGSSLSVFSRDHFKQKPTRSPGFSNGSFLVVSLFSRVYANFKLLLHSLPKEKKTFQK